ncbi:MAG: glycosyltransferase family 39 protein [Planctomycetaceae bacterium]|nr:glycosyltransferase family 39 protein [Planctomycetaceae bacterium]
MSIRVVADDQLPQLLRVPPRPLFSWLDRGDCLKPLLVILALAPGLAAIKKNTWNDTAALWAVRAADVSAATTFEEFLVGNRSRTTTTLGGQPPMASWLAAGLSLVSGISPVRAAGVVSYLSGAAVALLTFHLTRQLAGQRLAWLATVALVFQSTFLLTSAEPSPEIPGLAFLLAGASLYVGHSELEWRWYSWRLPLAGVCFAAAFLTIGLAALIVPLALLLALLYESVGKSRSMAVGSRRDFSNRTRKLAAWILCAAVAASLMIGWIATVNGVVADWGWREFITSLPSDRLLSQEGALELRDHALKSIDYLLLERTFLAGWIVIGWICLVSDALKGGFSQRERSMGLFVGWWLVAWIARVAIYLVTDRLLILPDQWDALLLVPDCVIAAYGIDAFLRRSVPLPVAALGTIITIGLATALVTSSWQLAGVAAVATAVLGLIVALIGQPDVPPGHDRLMRVSLRLLLFVLLFGHVALGMKSLRQRDDRQQQLDRFSFRLHETPEVDQVALLTERGQIPPRLLAVIRNRWPRAELEVASRWEGRWPLKDSPSGAGLLVEWSRRESLAYADLGTTWQVSSIGEPVRYRGRKLQGWVVRP